MSLRQHANLANNALLTLTSNRATKPNNTQTSRHEHGVEHLSFTSRITTLSQYPNKCNRRLQEHAPRPD